MDGPEAERHDVEANLNMALRVGEWNLTGMKLLDEGHGKTYGAPEPTDVKCGPSPGKVMKLKFEVNLSSSQEKQSSK